MPQITLGFIDNIQDSIEFNSLFHQLHQTINQIAGVSIENYKSWAKKINHYYVETDGKNKAFIHLDLFLLKGRTTAIK